MPPTNLYDYFKSKGQALPSVAQRQTTYGLGNDYKGTADQNTALLSKLQSGQSSAQAPTTPVTPIATPTATQAPVVPTGGNASGVADYLKSYLQTLTPTADETQTQNNLTDLEGATKQGVAGLEGRGLGIPLSIVRGQQGQLEKQGQLQQQTLQQKLANLQSQRKSAMDVSKIVLDRADAENKTASDRSYEESKLAKETAAKNSAPYTLNAGDTRYDATGNVVSQAPAKATVTKAVSTASPKGTTRSGGLTYTPQAAAEDSQALESSRGSDGHVDPTIYQNLYQAWIDNGGILKDFLSKYPPKNYVNPANTWLPKFLMPTSTAIKSSTASKGTTIDQL